MTVSTTPLANAYQGGTFAYYIHMDYTKQPLDYPQIIAMLKQRNLLICNDGQALEQLKIFSYFRLANYLRPMEQDKVSHTFKPSSHFEIAHHSRTWNRIYPIQPQLPQSLNGDWIDTSSVLNNRLYAQLCCLAYLQNTIHQVNDFKQQLKQLISSHPNVDVTAMGFPTDWINQPLWND